MLVEDALQVEIPERVKYIRTILDELNRIASHQLWWSAFGMDLGALTTFFYGLRDREHILDIFEESFGSRLLHSFNTPGGLMHDIHPNFQKSIKEFIPYFRKKLPEYDQLLTGNVIFQNRSIGIGNLSKETAIAYGVTGPSGRGSNYSCDIRKIAPYGAYDKVQFNEILETGCDTFARYKVRMAEMWESLNIIEQLVDNIPTGDFTAKMKPIIKLPAGEYFQTSRNCTLVNWQFMWLAMGINRHTALNSRTPNFSNLFVMNEITAGHKIADLIAISGSLDLVIPDY